MGRNISEFNYRGEPLHQDTLDNRKAMAAKHDALDPLKATLKSHGISWPRFANHVTKAMPDAARGLRHATMVEMHKNRPADFDKFITPLKSVD
ncbi:hypothetical protein UFOVP45_127 [uncultured Caudovirales phage]|uniref:Uncharacterized protein n=1 Tax=uncultured Caudovirales phage TaxID=2100421 RepID=A0A6J5KS33_9CAUD|nr:hypothetical protein UFOVP45_127 [uncultured Caudovirales phage]